MPSYRDLPPVAPKAVVSSVTINDIKFVTDLAEQHELR
jgi:hypothetical protein